MDNCWDNYWSYKVTPSYCMIHPIKLVIFEAFMMSVIVLYDIYMYYMIYLRVIYWPYSTSFHSHNSLYFLSILPLWVSTGFREFHPWHTKALRVPLDKKRKFSKVAYLCCIECNIIESEPLLQDKLSIPIIELFAHSSLLTLIFLSYPFHLEFLFKFFSNLHVNSEDTSLQTHVCGREVSFMNVNFHEYLCIFNNSICTHYIPLDLHYN